MRTKAQIVSSLKVMAAQLIEMEAPLRGEAPSELSKRLIDVLDEVEQLATDIEEAE